MDPKTVKRKVLAHEAGELDEERAERAAVPKNTDGVRDLVAERVAATRARMSAKRLLPTAQAAGYTGSPRNFRRVVAEQKRVWRATQARHQRRPAVWVPGDAVVIDWGTLPDGVKVFCAVVAWCRLRFVRFARDETAAVTMALLAECFETIGGVPAKVLADRMGCVKGGVVANVVIPTPDYVRFATHYGFRPDFCHPADPESKGIVEHLVGYAKRDIPIPDVGPDGQVDLVEWNRTAAAWCDEVNAAVHTETCAVPVEQLEVERPLLRALPSLRPRIGRVEVRTVDKLSTVRVASVRYSVPPVSSAAGWRPSRSTARSASTTPTVSSSLSTRSWQPGRHRCSMSTTRPLAGRRHAGHGPAPTSSGRSSLSASRPRRSSAPARRPGRRCCPRRSRRSSLTCSRPTTTPRSPGP